MPRRARIEYPGTTYHIYSRGHRRSRVFRRQEDYLSFLMDLERLSREHGARVLSFCLMPNHPHLCLRTDGDPISLIMQRLNLRHAKHFNRAYKVRGPLNESRYKASVVGSWECLLRLVRYIHMNPVKARLAQAPEDWHFSSHHAYLGLGYSWVETSPVLTRLKSLEGYLELMREAPPPGDARLFSRCGEMPAKDGSDLALIKWRPLKRGPWAAKRPEEPITEGVAKIMGPLGWDLRELAGNRRDRHVAARRRQLVKLLDERGYRYREIAALLGRQESAVCRLLGRMKGRTNGAQGNPGAATQLELGWDQLPDEPGGGDAFADQRTPEGERDARGIEGVGSMEIPTHPAASLVHPGVRLKSRTVGALPRTLSAGVVRTHLTERGWMTGTMTRSCASTCPASSATVRSQRRCCLRRASRPGSGCCTRCA